MNLRKISLVLFPTIGIILSVWFFVILFDQEQKVWVEKIETQGSPTYSKEFVDWWQKKINNSTRISDSYDPVVDFLSQKGVTIYDSKTEFRQELAQLCEGMACRTGHVKMYLISKKDIPELNKIWNP